MIIEVGLALIELAPRIAAGNGYKIVESQFVKLVDLPSLRSELLSAAKKNAHFGEVGAFLVMDFRAETVAGQVRIRKEFEQTIMAPRFKGEGNVADLRNPGVRLAHDQPRPARGTCILD